MKSKKFFKKALSVMMAALVSASTVFPVYAADLDGVEPVTETDASQTDSEGNETEAQQTEASVTEVLKATKADGDENTDANDQYALCLPRTEGIEYSYDEEHLDSEFSDQLSMYVLIYDENEKVEMTVKTDKEVSIVDGYSGDVFLSSDSIVDGKISFNMPATDLVLLPNEELETEQTESESAAVEQTETEVETETQTETETMSESETQTETEEQSEIQSETQTESETEAEVETETEPETNADGTVDLPEEVVDTATLPSVTQRDEFDGTVPEKNESEIEGKEYTIYKGDSSFNPYDLNAGYDPAVFNVSLDNADSFDINTVGDYKLQYTVTSIASSVYSWKVNVTVHVVDTPSENGLRIHVATANLSAGKAVYGNDAMAEDSSFTVSSIYKDKIDLSFAFSKDGKEIDGTDLYKVETDGNKAVVTLLSDFSDASYVVTITDKEQTKYDEEKGKAAGGWLEGLDIESINGTVITLKDGKTFDMSERDQRFEAEKYQMDIYNSEEEADEDDESGIATCATASDKKIKSKTFIATATAYSSATNYNPPGIGYNGFNVSFSASNWKSLKKWVKSINTGGVTFTDAKVDKLKNYTYQRGCSNHNLAGLPNSVISLSATAAIYKKANGRYYLKITYPGFGNPNDGYQYFAGSTKTYPLPTTPNETHGYLSITKKSDGGSLLNVSNVGINTSFQVASDANFTDILETLDLVAPSGQSSVTATSDEIDMDGKSTMTVYVRESGKAPGHAFNGKVYTVTLKKDETIALSTDPIVNYTKFGRPSIKKVGDNGEALENAIFMVEYFPGSNRAREGVWFLKSDANGNATFDADHLVPNFNGQASSAFWYKEGSNVPVMPVGLVKVTEVQAPEGYAIDPTPQYRTISDNNDAVVEIGLDPMNFTNKWSKGRIQVEKVDSESKSSTSFGSKEFYSMEGAEYTIYSDEACTKEIEALKIGEDGKSNVSQYLDIGTYYLKETVLPDCGNYEYDESVHPVEITANNVSRTPILITVMDNPVKGSLNIHKKLDPDEKDAIQQNRDLTKIRFSLTYKPNPDITIEDIQPDKDGNVHVDGLYFGTWILEETQGIDYHEMMDPVEIEISEDDETSVEYDATNYRYNDRLVIQKKDLDTGEIIPLAGCEFQIKDEVGELVALKLEGYSEKTDTFKTNELGTVNFDEKIPAGKYTLEEITAPDGYGLADPVEFEVTGKEADSTATVVMSDKRVTTGITVEKKDAVSGNAAGAGFTFNIVANENITDPAGNTYKGFEANAVVDTITTDEKGVASSNVELYPGRYHIEETGVAQNYLNDAEDIPFEVVQKKSEDGKWYAEVSGFEKNVITVKNNPVKRPIQVTKTDSESGNAAGADFTFTITADKVVDGTGNVYKGFEKGTVVDTITTDGRGIATSKDMYCGTYIIKETVRKQNYVLSTKEYPVTVSDEDKTSEPVKVTIKDEPLKKKVQVTKIDKVTGNHCGAGYKFQIVAAEDILDGSGSAYEGYKKDDVVDVITTNEDGIAVSKPLPMGSYYIQETEVSADGGMSINETKYPFTLKDEKKDGKLEAIKDTDEVMVLPITDIADTPTTLKIKKVDALQDKDGNPILDQNGKAKEDEKGNQPDPKPLEGIIFRVKAKEAADSDEQLYTTDKDGNIKVEYLKKNTTYTVKEYKTIPGYNLSDEVKEFTVDDKGQIEGRDIKELTFTNVPNQVAISKTDITNGNELPGAEMQLTDMDGNVLYSWTSGDKPYMIYGLPDGQYRLVEKAAPAVKDADGNLIIKTVDENGNEIHQYELATSVTQSEMPDNEQAITNLKYGIFTVKNSTVVQKVTMKDSPYRWVDLSKKTITGDDELPGCTLTVRDAQGDVVDTWVSTTEAHRIQLHSGVYTLTEEKPADGYVTAKSIDFTVIQTSDTDYAVQTVTMRDDVTKITVSKKDITNGEELPGAHLVIKNEKGDVVEEWTSTNETHYIEKLPIGKYTLTEITAPDGYETAETISFEIKDTGEIQHYDMFDSPYRPVEVSKKDITNKEELPGAKLEIRDAEDKVVDSWTSTSEAHKVDLPHGKYTLIETKPADGYTTAESIKFEVLERNTKEDNGVEVQHVEMEDDVTKVQISKQDVTTKKELPGAKLQIKDKDGKVVDEWTSTNEVHYIEKLPIGEYTLTETTAPNGYDVAESVNFKVLDTNEIQHVIMYDSPSVTPDGGTSTPKTGDISPVIPITVAVIIVVLAGAGIFLIKGKKKKDK